MGTSFFWIYIWLTQNFTDFYDQEQEEGTQQRNQADIERTA